HEEEDNNVFPFIEGEMIDLVVPDLKWVELACRWENDPEVRHYARIAWPVTIEQIKKRFEPVAEEGIKDRVAFMIYHKQDKRPIGDLGFKNIDWLNRCAEIFWTIGERKYWGRGIVVEAAKLILNYGFTELNLNKIYTIILSPNTRSLRAAKKMGFTEEGVFKEIVYIDSNYVDSHCLSLLKREWCGEQK
ncbi:MAG: GNAT family N-acetyltransferase, partial [Candidatus Hodarchaeota archaeon]